MRPEIAREGFQVVSGVLTTVAEEVMVTRREQKMIETKAEADKRIAELEAYKHGKQPSSADPEPSATDIASEAVRGQTDKSAESSAQTIDMQPLIESEECSMCVKLLESVAEMEPDKRAVGLAEYGKMKAAIDDGADAPELRDYLEGTDVLSEALEGMM